MAKKEGRGSGKNVFFKNQEMNFTLLRALMGTHAQGATIGECLAVVLNTKNSDHEAFIRAWDELGRANASRAEAAAAAGDAVRARECWLCASNYFKSATISVNPFEERHKRFWELSRDAFERAGALFDIPMERLAVPIEGKLLNCYFVPAAKTRSPTLFIVTGGEGSAAESYFWAGAYALRNGYSLFLYEGPGNYGPMHESGLTVRPDSEASIGRALDLLCARPDVDQERMAIMGISFGGYLAARAAAHDARIKALIPDTPLRDFYLELSQIYPQLFQAPKLIDFLKDHVMSYSDKAGLDLLLWEGGVKSFGEMSAKREILKQYSLVGMEHRIRCPTLALVGESEGAQILAQAEEFLRNIGSERKSLRVFTEKEGAASHCQADNALLMNQVMISWLNEVFAG
jgi:pimeloyl-ACP methyl ester carboxylesterase